MTAKKETTKKPETKKETIVESVVKLAFQFKGKKFNVGDKVQKSISDNKDLKGFF